MKTRQKPANFTASSAQSLTIQDIVKWKVPTGKILDDMPIAPHENDLVTVTGYVRLVKISPDDCDIHIQLGAYPGRHYPQIIAEIPPTEPQVRQALAQKLGMNIKKSTQYFDAARAVQVTLTGMAFDDSSHWSRAHPKTGNAHGSGVSTLWEVHPVWDVR